MRAPSPAQAPRSGSAAARDPIRAPEPGRGARRAGAPPSGLALALAALALAAALGIPLLGFPRRAAQGDAPPRVGLLQGGLAEAGLLRVRVTQRGWRLEATGSVDTDEDRAFVGALAGRLAPRFRFENRTTVHAGHTQIQMIAAALREAGLGEVLVSDAQGPIVTEGAVHTHYQQQLLRDIVRTRAPGRDHLDATRVTPW